MIDGKNKNIIQVNFRLLRSVAKEKRLSCSKIAERDGHLSPQTVVKVLNGTNGPTAVTLKRLCDVLELPIEKVFVTKAAA